MPLKSSIHYGRLRRLVCSLFSPKMENSGGDQLRIWLRNDEEDLDWEQTLKLLDTVLDETKDTNEGADCIDA